MAEGHVHEEALRGDERLIAVDRDLDGTVPHDENDAVVGPHFLLGFLAGGHRDIVAFLVLVAHNGLHPVALALMGGQDFRQLPVRLVGRRIGRHRGGLRRPIGAGHLVGGDGIVFLAQELGGCRKRHQKRRRGGGDGELDLHV